MKVKELIDKLANYDSDTEIYLYIWDTREFITKSEPLASIQHSREVSNSIFLLADNWPECMVGGHDEGCMCNLGFTPRWRNNNVS